METRKQKIITHYNKLIENINNLLNNKKILPDLNNYDICDLIYILLNHFSNCNESNYKNKIDYIIDLDTNIILDENERELIYDIIYEFVIWLQNLK